MKEKMGFKKRSEKSLYLIFIMEQCRLKREEKIDAGLSNGTFYNLKSSLNILKRTYFEKGLPPKNFNFPSTRSHSQYKTLHTLSIYGNKANGIPTFLTHTKDCHVDKRYSKCKCGPHEKRDESLQPTASVKTVNIRRGLRRAAKAEYVWVSKACFISVY